MVQDPTDLRPAQRYRFGIFDADIATGELRRRGMRVKLNAQPFQVLCMLLERPGELITREEISRELWPDGTFVDFDHGVNSAVNRIREALGDTAGSPRFVETLARRGYRFVAPVERIAIGENPALSSANSVDLNSHDGSAVAPNSAANRRNWILSTPQELPTVSHPVAQTLFALFQFMYLGFYIGALANLAEIEDLLASMPNAVIILNVIIVTAGVLIPVRAFVLCAALFHAPQFQKKFLKLWPFLLVVDVLWSLSPILLLHHINFGLALACTALLVYSPFAQRSIVLMGAGRSNSQNSTSASQP